MKYILLTLLLIGCNCGGGGNSNGDPNPTGKLEAYCIVTDGKLSYLGATQPDTSREVYSLPTYATNNLEIEHDELSLKLQEVTERQMGIKLFPSPAVAFSTLHPGGVRFFFLCTTFDTPSTQGNGIKIKNIPHDDVLKTEYVNKDIFNTLKTLGY